MKIENLPKDCANCKYYYLNCGDSYSCSKLNGKVIHCNFTEGMGCRYKDCPLKIENKNEKIKRL